MKKYWIGTWDHEFNQFTPQRGVRVGPYSLFGVRKAIRQCRALGFCSESMLVEQHESNPYATKSDKKAQKFWGKEAKRPNWFIRFGRFSFPTTTAIVLLLASTASAHIKLTQGDFASVSNNESR